MEAQNPLSELADIHLPGGVSWWPPAYGWWMLLLVIACFCAWTAFQWLRQYRRKRAMQSAINALDTVWRQYKARIGGDADTTGEGRGKEAVVLLNGINAVLRRVVLQQYPDTDLATLSGDRWLAFLDSCDGSTHFSARTGKVLGDASYRRSWDEDPAPVYKLAKAWIHRRYLLDKARPAAAEERADETAEAAT